MALSEEEYQRKYGGSPPFNKTNPAAIATGGVFSISYARESSDFPNAPKYGGVNFVMIRHGSTPGSDTRLALYRNGGNTVESVISPGEIRTFDAESTPGGFETIQLKNVGATTIAIGDIEVFAQKVPVKAEDVFRETHERLFSTKKNRY